MCGIIGYVGEQAVVPVLIEGLRRLEYRGYDSAGIAVVKDNAIQVRRRPGKLQALVKLLETEPLDGEVGLGHCLTPDTLIQLADGTVAPIGRLEGDVTVLSLDPESLRLLPRTAHVFRHRAPEKLIEIRTAGASITCTAHHRMMVMNADTGKVEEKFAGDLQAGDLLIRAKTIPAPLVTKEHVLHSLLPNPARRTDFALEVSLPQPAKRVAEYSLGWRRSRNPRIARTEFRARETGGSQHEGIQVKENHNLFTVPSSNAHLAMAETAHLMPSQQKKVHLCDIELFIPIRQAILQRRLQDCGLAADVFRPFRGEGYLTEAQAHLLIETLQAYPQAREVMEQLQGFLHGDVVFQEVQRVVTVDAPDAWVYDLEVPGPENFIANGLISHNSRWATHGRPSEENAHPHRSSSGRICVVHNGIIENYLELKRELQKQDHRFQSETDTEVVAHLIEQQMREDASLDFAGAFSAMLKKIRGIYALVAMSADEPDKLLTARLGPPLVIGIGEDQHFVASDIPAILPHTRDMFFLGDGEWAIITRDKVQVFDAAGASVKPEMQHVTWDPVQAEKGGFKHFMLKEIYEQPRAVRDTTQNRVSLDTGRVFLEEMDISEDDLRRMTDIKIASCGTAWHASLVAKYLIEELARVPVEVDYASEFRYRHPILTPTTLMMVISQSGETADTLAALREAKGKGCKSLAICNVQGAMMTREADGTIYTHAGPEIGVASTKAFTSQIVAAYLFALYLAQIRGTLSEEKLKWHVRHLSELPVKIEKLLNNAEADYEELSKAFVLSTDFLYLGRGINFPIALEGALKLKEISYIHAEGYAAGEMKHGPNALIDSRLPVVVINTLDPDDDKSRLRYEKTISNIQEVRARDGIVVAIVTEGDKDTADMASFTIEVPPSSELLSPILSAVPLQLLAYHIAVRRGCDVDQPRNLAKSVTVE